ncbi:putative toxin-antitoxin system toxin component, PIN family [Pseudorhodoferax sp.]|uniref:putative toxin-antitoxin system toxin component, PIN family n=1 Tax=Pseudorhodoferax sp. TaxID=1993553 RepID=UPI002DD6987E|nr:putative toxin-antitoxin system toxin component, PIN family [Pseudorhodoferax sp.]
MTPTEPCRAVVLDTNVALDLLLFEDASTAALREALQQGRLRWLVLPSMRAEFARVLHYPHLLAWRQARGRSADAALAAFDASSRMVDTVPAAAPVRCSDPDDQVFIDLAVAHRAVLLSKDRAVLAPRARLAALGVNVLQQLVTNRHPGCT